MKEARYFEPETGSSVTIRMRDGLGAPGHVDIYVGNVLARFLLDRIKYEEEPLPYANLGTWTPPTDSPPYVRKDHG